MDAFAPRSTRGAARAVPSEAPAGDADPDLGLRAARWLGWRARLLVACALLGCLGLFVLSQWLAAQPRLEASWRADAAGRPVLVASDDAALRALEGRALLAVSGAATTLASPDALLLQSSARWLVDDAARARHAALHARLAEALSAGTASLQFEGAASVATQLAPRGYGGLGALYWLLCATALLLYLAAMIAGLARPGTRTLLYAAMAGCQAGSLLFVAVESTLGLALPAGFAALELPARTTFDLVTAAAVVHAAALHPTRLPAARLVAATAWGSGIVLVALLAAGELAHGWWWTQGACIGAGAAAMALLGRSYRVAPHPSAVQLRRFVAVTVAVLALLTAAVAVGAAPGVRPVGDIGSVLWTVYFASLLLLVPFLARSQQLMREFTLLAAVSTIATALDLMFVAVFSLGRFTSLTLALFLALGVYAGARQWILNQLLGHSRLTTERMFEQLYRIAREVEANPASAAQQLSLLLRELFEPLEVNVVGRRSSRSFILAHGSTLLVPVPDLGAGADDPTLPVERSIVVRYAERGRRLFRLDDARLADRLVEQLRRAIAYDQAVERGRHEERARLAQDLHDDIGARLLTLMYKAPTPEMEDYVRHTLQDLKTLTRGLAAPSHRLSHAAAEWKADIAQRLAVAHVALGWSLAFDEDLLLSVVQWSGLTRVLRELVSNAIAHAQASRVSIDVTLDGDRLELAVADDGTGRDPRTWSHGLGLGGVRKRVKHLGGEVEWLELEPRGIACRVRIEGLSKRR